MYISYGATTFSNSIFTSAEKISFFSRRQNVVKMFYRSVCAIHGPHFDFVIRETETGLSVVDYTQFIR